MSSVSVVPDAQARHGLAAEPLRRRTRQVAGLNQACCPTWRSGRGPTVRSCWPTASRAERRFPTTIRSRRSAKISAPLRADYTLARSRLALGVLHDRRRQQPDPAGRSAVRLLHHAAHAGGEPGGDAHLLAGHAEHVPRRVLARRRSTWIRLCWRRFRPVSRLSTEPGPGGIVVGGGVTTTGLAGHHLGRSQQRRRRLEPQKSVSPSRTAIQINAASTRSASASGFSGSRTTKTRRRASSGRPRFTSLTTFLQGTVEHVSSGARAQRTGLAKPVRRLVLRGHHQAAPAI